MDWLNITIYWYFHLLIIGLIAFPLTKKVFGRFFDFGYPFAKTIAILLLTYSVFLFGILKIIPFTQTSLMLLLLLSIIVLFIFNKSLINKADFTKNTILLFILEEVIFFLALIFLTFIRSQEPSIRGLEKFMDFGFINSILRSKFFPPLDMWLSADINNPNGYSINYYYFGHLSGALLIKLTGVKPAIGYNLILATIFAQGITLCFSLIFNLIYKFLPKISNAIIFGIIGSFIVNFGGNLHTIYLFTSGYSPDNPIPFWKILSVYNPTKYWYPNATRFIPLTIHEFPAYSYVVADLHGHVFDIPFVLLTLALVFSFFISFNNKFVINQKAKSKKQNDKVKIKNNNLFTQILSLLTTRYALHSILIFGFLTAVHYMTNAFDGPIYILLIAFILLVVNGFTLAFLIQIGLIGIFFMIFSFPFSANFAPFVSGIGVNCSPDFLVKIQKLGPFLFEKGNCQADPLWMLFVLWGFFFIALIILLALKIYEYKKHLSLLQEQKKLDLFIIILFFFGFFLITIPEFFYIKDIYPAHFRANTMFKLGYQAFIIMSLGSIYVLNRLLSISDRILKTVLFWFFIPALFLVFIYSFFSFPSYYGNRFDKIPQIDGSIWLESTFPEDKEIIDYLNANEKEQPNILEAQGDSYTDFERISAYTGLPTVAGWWVHEWLWRGSADIVGSKIPDIINLYESKDIHLTKNLLEKYQIKYVVISKMERDKYKNINEEKFAQLGKKIFTSSNGFGALYQVK